MRISLMPFLVPAALVGAFSWGVNGVTTKGYDQGFFWFLVIGSSVAAVTAVGLYVNSVEDRLRRLEEDADR